MLLHIGRRAIHASALTTTSFQQRDAALLLLRVGNAAVGQVASVGYADGAFISGGASIAAC